MWSASRMFVALLLAFSFVFSAPVSAPFITGTTTNALFSYVYKHPTASNYTVMFTRDTVTNLPVTTSVDLTNMWATAGLSSGCNLSSNLYSSMSLIEGGLSLVGYGTTNKGDFNIANWTESTKTCDNPIRAYNRSDIGNEAYVYDSEIFNNTAFFMYYHSSNLGGDKKTKARIFNRPVSPSTAAWKFNEFNISSDFNDICGTNYQCVQFAGQVKCFSFYYNSTCAYRGLTEFYFTNQSYTIMGGTNLTGVSNGQGRPDGMPQPFIFKNDLYVAVTTYNATTLKDEVYLWRNSSTMIGTNDAFTSLGRIWNCTNSTGAPVDCRLTVLQVNPTSSTPSYTFNNTVIFYNLHMNTTTQLVLSKYSWDGIIMEKTASDFKPIATYTGAYTNTRLMANSARAYDNNAIITGDAYNGTYNVFAEVDANATKMLSVELTVPTNTTYAYTTKSVDLNYTVTAVADRCWYNLTSLSGTHNQIDVTLTSCANAVISNISEDFYSLKVYANISTGESAMATVNFTIAHDNVLPTMTLNSPANTTYPYGTASISLNYTAGDFSGIDKCWYVMNNTGGNIALPSCANTTLSGLTAGFRNLKVYANDSRGNTALNEVNFSIVDNTAPSVILSLPLNTTYNSRSVPFSYSVSNGEQTVLACTRYVDGTPTYDGLVPNATSLQGNMLALTYTSHNIYVVCDDGLLNGTSQTVYFTVEDTAPTVVINNPANTTYNTKNIAVNFSVTDNQETTLTACSYVIDGADTGVGSRANGSTYQASVSHTTGQHNILARCSDGYLNGSSSLLYYTYQDITPPTMTLFSPANTTYYNASIPIEFSASDENILDECLYQLDDGDSILISCSANSSFTSDGGLHKFFFYVDDEDQNANTTTVYYTMNVIPTTMTISNYTNQYPNSTAQVWASYLDNESSVITGANCTIDGTILMTYNSTSQRYESDVLLSDVIGSWSYTIQCKKSLYESRTDSDYYNVISRPSLLTISNIGTVYTNTTSTFWADYRTGDNLYELLDAVCMVNAPNETVMPYNVGNNRYEYDFTSDVSSANYTVTINCSKLFYEDKSSIDYFEAIDRPTTMSISNIGTVDVLSTQTIYAEYEYLGTTIADATCAVSGNLTGYLSYSIPNDRYEGLFTAQNVPDNYSYTITCGKQLYDNKALTDGYETKYLSSSITVSDFIQVTNGTSQMIWADYQAGGNDIENATCISIGTFSAALDYNATDSRYEKIVTAPTAIGNFTYNITCNKTYYISASGGDTFQTIPEGLYPTTILISNYDTMIMNTNNTLYANYKNLSSNTAVLGANCVLSGLFNNTLVYNSTAQRYETIVLAPTYAQETMTSYSITCSKSDGNTTWQTGFATDSFNLRFKPTIYQAYKDNMKDIGEGTASLLITITPVFLTMLIAFAAAAGIIYVVRKSIDFRKS